MVSNMGTDDSTPLGIYLKRVREAQGLSLRDVQSKVKISNAFLSQIESGKVKNPSPVMLHKLATVYCVPYEHLMERAGYPIPEARLSTQSTTEVFHRFGNITHDEEEQLLDYLGFLRSRARRGNK